jgi:hypothetical protein
MATDTKTEVTYITDRPGLILIVEPGDYRYSPRGNVIGTLPALRIEFTDGRADLRVDKKGRLLCNGKALPKVENDEGDRVNLTLPELVERLEEREDFEGSFEREPEPPKPTTADLDAALKRADEIQKQLEADQPDRDNGGGEDAADGDSG